MRRTPGRAVAAALAGGLMLCLAALLVLGAPAPGALAQDGAGGPDTAWLEDLAVPYDAVRVVQRAVHRHMGVQIAQLQYAAAQARAVESRAALRPALTVDVRPYWLEAYEVDYGALSGLLPAVDIEDIADQKQWEELRARLEKAFEQARHYLDNGLPRRWYEGRAYTVTLTGRLPLWRSPLQRALDTIASADQRQAAADLEAAVGAAVVQSLEAYYGVLRAEAALRIARLALEEVELRAGEIASRRAAGTATRLDELQVEAERHQAEARVLQARGEVQAARMALNQMLGYPLDAHLNVVETDIPAAWPELDEAIALSARRADVLRALNDLEKARAGAVIAREQASVGLRLFGQYQWPETELQLGVDRHGYLGGTVTYTRLEMDSPLQQDQGERWTVGVEVSWPVFDGHQRRAQAAQAELQARQAELAAEQLQKMAVTEVTAAYARLQAAAEALDGARRGVAAAQEALAVAQELHAAGAATRRDVLQARMGLAQAEMGRLEATYAFTLAQAAYLQSAGVVLSHWLTLAGLDYLLDEWRAAGPDGM